MNIKVHPRTGSVWIDSPAGSYLCSEVGSIGWHLHTWAPGDTETAGTFLGHFPTSAAALALLELDVESDAR